MKKILMKCFCLSCIVLLTGCTWSKNTSNGPTSVFVAGKTSLSETLGMAGLIGSIILIMAGVTVAAGIILYKKTKKKDSRLEHGIGKKEE